jgi:hypothetical protein
MAVGGDCCVSEDQFEADRTQSRWIGAMIG